MVDARIDFLDKQTVSGDLLSERIARGPVPLAEALRLAIEFGAALHKIHSQGLVHGGLSPLCIAPAPGGARILQPTPSTLDRAAYRAPEELLGQQPDERSDIFAFGALLYEIVAGTRAFPGTGEELDRRILTENPAPLPGNSPQLPALNRVIAGCLEKDPAQRRQRVQNAVTELKLAAILPLSGPPPRQPDARRSFPAPALTAGARVVTLPRAAIEVAADGPGGLPSPAFRRRAWPVGAALLALAATSLAAVLYLKRKPAPVLLEFAVTSPENTTYPGMPSVSPDGRYLTFSALGREGARLLWLRPLDALHASVIPGSEGASAPFWSPDSQAIGFFAAGYLKKVRITGGAPENICAVEAAAGGGAWNPDGAILFAPGLYGGLYRVPATGGSPRPVLKLDQSKFERADLWPQFLPNGNHFVFYQQTDLAETSGVYLGSLDKLDQQGRPVYRRLFASQTNAVYSPAPAGSLSGHLLYLNQRNLLAQPFHPGRLEIVGEPIAVAGDIGAIRSLALAPISVSATGVLVYQGVGQPTRQMVWVDRAGKQLAVSGAPAIWGPPRISPDGSRAVAARTSSHGDTAHLWLLQPDGGARQMDDEPMHQGSPVWSPDGSRIAFFGMQGESYDIFVRAAQPGSRPELLLKSGDKKFPSDWSRDGRYLAFSVEHLDTRLNVWAMSVAGRRAEPVLDSIHAEGFATFSADGKWLAYQSDQSGRNEVYIQAFDGINHGTSRPWMVSAGGGLPRWRSDGGELFYITADGRIMSVALAAAFDAGAGGNLQPAAPRILFPTRPVPGTWNLYDVSPDGRRFLLNIPLEWTGAEPMTVLANWTEKLQRQK